jgi:RNA polymerase sigma factor (sigma-70 family)
MPGPSDILLEKLSLIEQILVSICHRKGMRPEEIEEFSSVVKLHLVENDYAIIRAFRGRSSFATYIAAVITRLLLDHRNREWGKWRSSAEATRLGETAVLLEKLLYRDQRSHEEAMAALVAKYPKITRAEAEALVARIPPRVRRRRVDIDDAASEATHPESAAAERTETAMLVSSEICNFIDHLSDDDQLLIRLRFDSEMTVADIARALHLDQGVLYRRLYQLFADLRKCLESAGFRAQDVTDLIGNTEVLDFHFKNGDVRPSDQNRKRWRPGRRKARHDR